MAEKFRKKDPMGIQVYCTDEQWDGHIIEGHPEMKDNIQAVVSTIEDPDYIYESHDSDPPMDERRIYNKIEAGGTYDKYAPVTKVVVSVLGGSGEVVAAYDARTVTGGAMQDESGGYKEAIYVAPRNQNKL